MDRPREEKRLTPSVENLYLNLLYCRGDARIHDLPYLAHLLNLACEELQNLADADERSPRTQTEWNAFDFYPDMR